MSTTLRPLIIAISATLSSTPIMADELQSIVVSADLREATEQDIPASVDVKTQADLQDQGATHFDDVLLKTPNVNFSGQSSRARHIQIRGMGERDEYTGAPNSSVGFAIDDIDFSGIGMTGNLFDVKQVEVLRGPQNTRYGQSAIGGLINIQTNDPTATRESMVEATIGQDNHKELGIMTSGPVSSETDATQYRIAIFKHNSDGFRTNETLDRTDTNGRDELTLRGKLRFFPDSDTTVDVSLIHADLNNGYDAWSRDNSFRTVSNEPGKDTQLSNAGAVKIKWEGSPNYALLSKTSLTNTDAEYSYDADWLATDYEGFYENLKHRRTFNQELRWSSKPGVRIFNDTTDWLIGFYASKTEESNQTNYWVTKTSDFNMIKSAIFSQLDFAISPKATIQAGLRIEQNSSDFSSSLGDDFSSDEGLWGANLTYSYKYNSTHTAYIGTTRGYKASGYNVEQPANTPTEFINYKAETLMNYELGLKSKYSKYDLKSHISLFYMNRTNPQFDGYTVAPTDPDGWVFYTENLDSATNYGLEAKIDWQTSRKLNLNAAIGLLKTDVTGTPLNTEIKVSDREQAHAPSYQINFGANYRSDSGFYAQADVTAIDAFYFDNTHNFKSKAYHLINARIGYEAKDYEVYVWGKNLTDETYATRGFRIGLDWPYTNEEDYIRLGDPRQFGVTARVYF